MNVGSLFSGIGGLDLGLERAGMRVVWQVEIDDYCRRVLAKHWPDVKRFEDVRDVGRHNLEAVDLICGGFPCIDISSAGAKAGIDGRHSGLWAEFARIIGELRPRLVVVENVAALLHRGLDRVLGDLAACGYDAEWDCIPAAVVGQPVRRWRVFLVAYPNSGRREGSAERNGIYAQHLGRPHALRLDVAQRRAKEAASRIRGMDNGLPRGVDRLKSLGNAVVPQVAEFIGRLIMDYEAAEAA